MNAGSWGKPTPPHDQLSGVMSEIWECFNYCF